MKANRIMVMIVGWLIGFSFHPLHSQVLRSTYPIQITAFLQPPYSLYLSDYGSADRDRVIVTLLNRDLQESEVSVQLHVSLSAGGGSVKLDTRDSRPLPVFRLPAGVPVRLSSADLSP
ncbi:MAG: hypothetical protein LBH19_13885, partial [Dysgonamonadaceae bacterium]|nr:hypothetical protein [Dysgonamonadaceae bacterium]